MVTREQKLQRAVNKLSKYYGLYNARDLSARVGLDRSTAGPAAPGGPNPSTASDVRSEEAFGRVAGISSTSSDVGTADRVITDIIETFVDTTDGAYDSPTLVNVLATKLTDANEEQKNTYKSMFNVIAQATTTMPLPLPAGPLTDTNIDQLLGGREAAGIINQTPKTSNKETPTLSMVFCNSKRISVANKNTNACTVFLNGVPNLEISKAIPYLDVQFLFDRPPVDSKNRLQTPSMLKFLLGGKEIQNSSDPSNPEKTMAFANTTQIETTNINETRTDTYSVAGMEMFTSPQTLVNANETDDESLRSVSVLDKFRPMMTLKDFSVEVQSSQGLMSFKTGKLSLILHDRSRLAEVSDLIKPDLYGRTEILIEYGWIHPDGERNNPGDIENVYGDLINGMRVREKFGIRNSSFTFAEGGEVSINLDLYTRGGTDMSTEVISSDSEGLGNVIREVQQLQDTISSLRQRIFSQSGAGGAHPPVREIRGVQILDASSDALSHTILTSGLRDALRDFRTTFNRNGTQSAQNPNLQRLIQSLDSLYGENAGTQRRGGAGRRGSAAADPRSALGRLRTTVIESVQNKVGRLSSIADPFLYPNYPPTPAIQGSSRQVNARTRGPGRMTADERTASTNYNTNFGTNARGQCSLATLLLHFIGQPLANTKKFDDIQLIFYPFNSYAGFASKLNVGNFEVDLPFFASELLRMRLNNISRNANMTLREFMSFVGQSLVDDSAAKSYGLWDDRGAFFNDVFPEGLARDTGTILEAPELQQRMENRLRGVTPDGSFKMPQIEFFMECVPGKTPQTDGQNTNEADSNKTVLKIHVYDRVASSYETLGALLASARNSELEAIGRIPDGSTSGGAAGEEGNVANTGVIESNRQNATAFIHMADSVYGLIQEIPNSDPKMYRIAGGPRKLREFLYQTTPYIIYGAGGTLVKQANLSSMQNPELSTVNMLRNPTRSDLEPNGEQPGGLPMRIIPTELSLETFGCPLLTYTGQFFVDFQTGTSADNIYSIIGLTHKISEGDFTTSVKMTPIDAYGKYESFMNRIFNSLQVLNEMHDQQVADASSGGGASPTPTATNPTRNRSAERPPGPGRSPPRR